MLIHATRLLHPDGRLAEGWVRLDGSLVSEVGSGGPSAVADLTADLLAPGFVDVHCHGGGGASFTSGDADEAARVADTHATHGTTTLMASLVSDTVAVLTDQILVLRALVEDGLLGGIHLEGPWLSPSFAGAHDPDALTTPNPADVERLLTAAAGSLRMVTIAPELPGARDTIRRLAETGVVTAIGHTDADAHAARAAFDAGATVVTHLFNAMRPVHHRRPGPVPVALSDAQVAVELIADGVHLDPSVLAMAARGAAGGFLLVSDAMAAAGSGDGQYRLGPLRVTVHDGVARLDTTGTIAGSTLTLHQALRNTVAAGIPLDSALIACTHTPAARLGLAGRGVLAPGARADLVTMMGFDLEIHAVMRAGRWITAPR